MSPRPSAVPGQPLRPTSAVLLLLSLLVCALASTPSAASAAQRLEVFDLPSAKGNIDPKITRLNATTKLQATVLLPDGYDEQPGRAWPVLYLLHGVGDNTSTWSTRDDGDITRRAAGFPGIIVMPEGGRSYWLDWWLGGQRSGGNWGQYVLEEVLPEIERRYRILPGRDQHAIGGLSMGGYGAMLMAARLPTYFGSVVSLSGLYDMTTPLSQVLIPFFSGNMSFTRTWGPYGGAYARANSPRYLLPNLARARMFLTVGNAIGDPNHPQFWNINAIVAGGAAELGSWAEADAFARAARAQGIPTKLRFRQGVHSWLYWRRDVPHMLAWKPIAPAPPVTPGQGEPLGYRTMAGHGNAWGLGFKFDALPRRIAEFTRSGQIVTATGAGRVTITPGAADADASGNGSRTDCQFTAELPFTHTLPTGC